MTTTSTDAHAVAPAPLTLSTAMREGSREQHVAAEGSTFMGALLGGDLPPAAYVDYLRCLRSVYDSLETLVRDRREEIEVAAVHDPGLERLALLDADLAHWTDGRDPRSPQDPPAPAAAYVERLRSLATGPATRVVAHHYTRYLGDLSGGQVVGRLLGRAYDVAPGRPGLDFYAFGAVPKPKPYKDAYRARLDALALTAAQRAEVVDEVCRAFTLNQGLLADLGRRHGLA